MSTQVIKNVGIPEWQKVGKQSRDDCICKYTTPQNVKGYVGVCILNCFYALMLLSVANLKKKEEHNYRLFGDFLVQYFMMIYSTAMSLV